MSPDSNPYSIRVARLENKRIRVGRLEPKKISIGRHSPEIKNRVGRAELQKENGVPTPMEKRHKSADAERQGSSCRPGYFKKRIHPEVYNVVLRLLDM